MDFQLCLYCFNEVYRSLPRNCILLSIWIQLNQSSSHQGFHSYWSFAVESIVNRFVEETIVILVFMSCAGSKERKPRSLHGRTCRRQKLKQQYRNSRFTHTQHDDNKRFREITKAFLDNPYFPCRKCSSDLIFLFFFFCSWF